MHVLRKALASAAFASIACAAAAAPGGRVPPCEPCAAWNESQAPFKLFGNSWYVGTHGLGSILITSDKGHVLIDGALPESAPKIAANVRALGFKVEDIKVILNSHDHYDHAGGIAELQRLSGARMLASPPSAKVLEAGESGRDDPQFGILEPIAKVSHVATLKDGGTVRVGPLALVAHFTPGHTAGGTSWTWKSCEGTRCLNIVYADSLTPVSAPTFKFTGNTRLLNQFEKSYEALDALPCDILITPHPEASNLWERLESRETQGNRDALLETSACDMYVAASRERLRKRLAQESAD
jgi:metallo-beta-lactamase class B